jgi:hypothetical protein
MPDTPIRRVDYIPVKLRSVSMSQRPSDPVSPPPIVDMRGSDAAQIPPVPPPRHVTRTRYRDINASRPGFQADDDDAGAGQRIFTSWTSGSQPSHDAQEYAEPEVSLPRTRYRFGDAVPGCRDPGPPPNPSVASSLNSPARTAAVLLRIISRNTRIFAAQYAGRPYVPSATVASDVALRAASDAGLTPNASITPNASPPPDTTALSDASPPPETTRRGD